MQRTVDTLLKKTTSQEKIVLVDNDDFIDLSSWNKVESNRNYLRSSPSELRVSFTKETTKYGEVTRLNIVIGDHICNKLKWSMYDRINVLTHKDDAHLIMLLKSEEGFKLTRKNKDALGFSFKWTATKMDKSLSTIVKHQILHRNSVLTFHL